jgi:tetratricopeptide (TPR) repeat protein
MATKKKGKSARRVVTRPVSAEPKRAFPRKWRGFLVGALAAGAVLLITMSPRRPSERNPTPRNPAQTAPATETVVAVQAPAESDPPAPNGAKTGVSSPQHTIRTAFADIAEDIDQIHTAERALAEQTLADFPDSAEARILMAKVLRHHGDSDSAMRHLQQALTRAPQRGDVFEEMALIAKDKGDWERAQAILERGISAVPEAAGLRWHLADIHASRGNYEAALPLLESEQKIAPQTARVSYLLGQVYSQTGRYDLARAHYEKTIHIHPNHVNAYYALGSLCLKRKQMDQAKTYMATFRRLNEQFQTHVDERDQAGDVKRARQRVARFIYLSSTIYDRHGQREVAAQYLDKAATLDPDNPLFAERQAVQAYQDGRLDRAAALYDKAYQLDPSKAIYLLNLSNIYSRLGRPDRVEAVLLRALERFPDDPRAYQTLIRFYLKHRRQVQRSIQLARQVLRLQESAENYFLLACAHYANQELDQSLQALEAALQRDPGNPKYRGMHDQIKPGLQ